MASLSISGGILEFLPVLVNLLRIVNFFFEDISGLESILFRLLKYFCLDVLELYSKSFLADLYFSKSFFALVSSSC